MRLPVLVALIASAAWVAPAASAQDVRPHGNLVETLGEVPLCFETNLGQYDDAVQFAARGPGYALFLTATESVTAVPRSDGAPSLVRMSLVDGDPDAAIAARDPQRGRVNYFRGSDPAKWRTDVPLSGKVRYTEVYPGIDVVYYGKVGTLSPCCCGSAVHRACGGRTRVDRAAPARRPARRQRPRRVAARRPRADHPGR